MRVHADKPRFDPAHRVYADRSCCNFLTTSSPSETRQEGTTRTVEAALPHLVPTKGTIVTTAAYSIRSPEIARLPFAGLKSAVAVFTKGIAKEYGQHGIRANCVCPGAVETETLRVVRDYIAMERGYPHEEALERVMVEEWGFTAALGRPGQPHEVGELTAFLLSPRAGFLTGALINIDGGTNF